MGIETKPASNTVIANNILVDCRWGIGLGAYTHAAVDRYSQNCTVENNIIVNSTLGTAVAAGLWSAGIDNTTPNLNNKFVGNVVVGHGNETGEYGVSALRSRRQHRRRLIPRDGCAGSARRAGIRSVLLALRRL